MPPAVNTLPRRARSLAGRGSLMVAGCAITTLCYAITIRATLGLGTLFVLQDGLAHHVGVSIGTSVMIVGFALVAVAVCLRSWPGPGTLVLPVIGGLLLNAVLPHLPTLHTWPVRIAAVVAATWVMALGGAMVIRASVGVSAYDAVMLGLHRVFGRPLAPTRLAMEATALAAGWLLGGAVGLGTVITGLLIGPGLQFWLRRLGAPVADRPRRRGRPATPAPTPEAAGVPAPAVEPATGPG